MNLFVFEALYFSSQELVGDRISVLLSLFFDLVSGLEKTTAEPWKVILVQLFAFEYFQREAHFISSG